MTYAPLHVHSEYSLLSGLSQTKHIAGRLEEIGVEACALTDYGTVSGAVDFQKIISGNFKPILGCDFYLSEQEATLKEPSNEKLTNQVVLAKDIEGWKKLLSLVSESNKPEHFYRKPRLGFEQFLERVSGSGKVISFSGQIGSRLANIVSESGDWKKEGIKEVERMQEVFGKGNFYIEIQLINSLVNQKAKEIGEKLREISIATGIPCVATPDSHYCKREDAHDQRVLLCTGARKSVGQIQGGIKEGLHKDISPFFESENFHLPSYEDMKEFHTGEELANTLDIASQCSEYNILGPPNPPVFDCPQGMSPNDYLRYLCREGWTTKMGHIDKDHAQFQDYGSRVNKEIKIFTETNLSSYFLIVRDIIQYADTRGYLTGPGRGSAAGCIVSYLMDITKIDPIPYDLIFERFYNAGRNAGEHVSMPDIDIDVPKHSRNDIIEYVKNKYGKDNVAQIITFQTLKGRAALKRVMAARGNIGFDEQNTITSHILDEAKIADELQDMKDELGTSSVITWALENKTDKLKDWCYVDDNGNLQGRFAKIFEQAIRLEDTKIIQSKHAAGVVISPQPIYDVCPMVLDREEKNLLAGFEGPSCEDVGLLKLDVLGIKMLDKVMEIPNILMGV
jgi:DNA polymerase III subunit alpha|tara:strand:+ start:7279 stop:9141 length:1863 start_codon:yes stop_codon:yes gene_type:complete